VYDTGGFPTIGTGRPSLTDPGARFFQVTKTVLEFNPSQLHVTILCPKSVASANLLLEHGKLLDGQEAWGRIARIKDVREDVSSGMEDNRGSMASGSQNYRSPTGRIPQRFPAAQHDWKQEGRLAAVASRRETVMAMPSIEGTYRLVRRELPDGTVQHPPLVKGMLTYTKEYRNFSVVWKDDDGRYYSSCYVARYKLRDKEYTETSEYIILHDPARVEGVSYDLSENTARSPVSVEGRRVRFALQQPFERALSVTLEFDGRRLTATGKDRFVDSWEKVSEAAVGKRSKAA
jgi:hypothetical protein